MNRKLHILQQITKIYIYAKPKLKLVNYYYYNYANCIFIMIFDIYDMPIER